MSKREESSGIFRTIERIGNKIPSTMVLFLGMIVCVVVLSAICSLMGVSAVGPQSGETFAVVNLLSIDGLLMLLTKMVANFAAFPILGVTLVVGIAMGVCEVGGFFSAAVKYSFRRVGTSWVAVFVSFLGVFMCSFDGAVSHVVVPTLAAAIYLSIGKNPVAGVISGYAAAATGAAMEFVPAFWQVALTPLTIEYAQLVDPDFTMPLMSDTYGMLPASCLAVVINAVVTIKVIEPRIGPYRGRAGLTEEAEPQLSSQELTAVRSALLWALGFIAVIALACIPANSFFRGEGGSLVVDAPLMASFENLLFFLFFIPGVVYAKKTGQIRSMNDLVGMMERGLSGLLSFVVMVLVISQFLALFDASNLAKVFAIRGGAFLSELQVAPVILVIVVFFVYAIINLFIVSGSTKYMIFGTFLVPMLMQMNFHPAFIQFMLRLADGSTNQMSPLNAFFPVAIALCKKYDEDFGVGTALSALSTYAVCNIAGFLGILLLFYFTGLPLGLGGARVWFS